MILVLICAVVSFAEWRLWSESVSGSGFDRTDSVSVSGVAVLLVQWPSSSSRGFGVRSVGSSPSVLLLRGCSSSASEEVSEVNLKPPNLRKAVVFRGSGGVLAS